MANKDVGVSEQRGYRNLTENDPCCKSALGDMDMLGQECHTPMAAPCGGRRKVATRSLVGFVAT